MAMIHLVPIWFYNFGIIINFLFFVIAGAVSAYSYKIYRLSCQKEIKYFSLGFGAISLAYLAKLALFLTTFKEINEKFVGVIVENLNTIGVFLTYSHLILFVLGVAALAYATLKIDALRIYLAFLLLSAAAIFFSVNKIKSSLILSSIFLLFVSYHYGKEYIQNKNVKTALIFIGFVLLLASKLEVSVGSFYLSYLLEQLTELVAYIFISISLVFLLRPGKKT